MVLDVRNRGFRGSARIQSTNIVRRRSLNLAPVHRSLNLPQARQFLGMTKVTVTFRLFEGIGVVGGCGRAKLSEKRMHFVREKRDKPPAGASMREKDCEKSEKSEKRPTQLVHRFP
jgi:hypothetical protein